MVPDVFRGGHFLLGDKQTQKRKVKTRSLRQHLSKNQILVFRCPPAKPKCGVNGIRVGVICEYYAEITQRLFSIALNQEEVGGLPSDMRGRWVRFDGTLHTLFLLLGAALDLVS